jgi:hypothetical protein
MNKGRGPASVQAKPGNAPIEIGLSAAIVTVHNGQPQILVATAAGARGKEWDALPFGPFSPHDHRTLEIGLRRWVKAQTGLELGYVEQLYTFGDRGRHARELDTGRHVVSVGYLALAPHGADTELSGARWSPWYVYMPWEDWRSGKPEILEREIEPRLQRWAEQPCAPGEPERALTRAERLRICFAIGGRWDEEKALERYELLYEAGLAAEAARDGREAAKVWSDLPPLGRPMQHDHRRILATAIGRLRGKLKYRPVIFELLPESFTLFELQKTVESIFGTHLHKQNFRRLVENAGLVELTGDVSTATGGRPARLYRFRREVLLERPSPGVRVRAGRG